VVEGFLAECGGGTHVSQGGCYRPLSSRFAPTLFPEADILDELSG
jgi:hypothetical protein